MSADNLVGVRQLPNGYWAVLELQYHEVDWAEHQDNAEAALDSLFTEDNRAELFKLERDATRRAMDIAESLYVCEYGVMDFPRPFPIDGPVGNYKVVVAKMTEMEYHLSGVTPEAAVEKAFELAQNGHPPNAVLSENGFKVISTTSS